VIRDKEQDRKGGTEKGTGYFLIQEFCYTKRQSFIDGAEVC